ncbi:hypothetical protein JOQ06_016247 [Pogonophryne albipinna]|uniref:MAM domain-containing protein n=1 Tax=Pogonophryne albipinna TaxID=1090488 RepID=A0AAD6FC72_9TELE|nr:hypothetical protein JOQ06_016247 [Pogonophryne albipinna]
MSSERQSVRLAAAHGAGIYIPGCTFDEDLDPGLCEYRQGQDDDFDWQLIRTFNWPHPTPDLLRALMFIYLK